MPSALFRTVKRLLPAPVYNGLRRVLKARYGWKGRYTSWSSAVAASSGYSQPEILSHVADAIDQVRSGRALGERDSVTFDEPQYSWPLLAALMRVAASTGRLHVIDFGGSLGSTYFQHKRFFDSLDVSWTVVEQPHFVAYGKEHLQDGVLGFQPTIDAATEVAGSDILVLSSVLQYLEDPYEFLADTLGSGQFRYVVIDRTPILAGEEDRLTVQRVDPSIYRASYPCWFFGEHRLLSALLVDYSLVARFEAIDGPASGAEFVGYFLERPNGR